MDICRIFVITGPTLQGLAFTKKEIDADYLRGLLPPVLVNHDVQVKKMMHNIRQYEMPLQRYQAKAMMDLQMKMDSKHIP
ncbi:putative malate dehydrogenase (oxaloacetate-decarboxylating) (NADP(+)) [Helianthus annuus]|nr:putative malate dehydrogenase (oxaloacetate-decarboxylating) (NADP(+)) [Helianthus annuus]